MNILQPVRSLGRSFSKKAEMLETALARLQKKRESDLLKGAKTCRGRVRLDEL
jgi:hypothetical protein